MAFSWDLITNTLGAALPIAGQALGTGAAPWLGLGTGVLQALGQGFGITDGGGGAGSPQKAMEDAAKIQQLASFTATGAEGPAANRESAQAARKFIGQSTAEGLRAAQQQQALGSMALGGAQQTTDLARSAAMMNLGNQRRDLMQQAAAGGSSPAALAGIASNLGQSNTQTLNSLAQQGAQAQQAGLAQAGQAFAASEQTRNADLAQQLANFQPYALQKFGGTSLGQVGGYQQTQQGMAAAEDPMALLKAMGGQLGTQQINKPYEDETARRQLMMGLAKDPGTLAELKKMLGIP